MATGIDHVVIAVRDLDQAIADYTAAGFTVTPGGEHVNGQTHNALVAFLDGSYFELIAWKDPDTPQDTEWWRRMSLGEGLVDYALRVADLDAEVERLRGEGLDVPEPVAGGRTRPDGERVEWQTLRLDPIAHPALPFYCHSTNDRALRVPSGEAAAHDNGATGIEAIFIGVTDLEQAAADYAKVAGIAGTDRPSGVDVENDWRSFQVGAVTVTLVKPTDPASDLAQTIASRGNVPIEVVLQGQASHAGPIDETLTHGAKLAIVPIASIHADRSDTGNAPVYEDDAVEIDEHNLPPH
jgi:hypothetical protein